MSRVLVRAIENIIDELVLKVWNRFFYLSDEC
jgi:hypothetical protein